MSLFPACSFEVQVPRGIIVSGERMDAVLVLNVPHDIPRADHIEVLFQTLAWAGYGGGKSRTVVRRNMFQAPLHLSLPKGEPLSAGIHPYPFAVDLPAWLPPAYVGNDCGINHVITTRLDVEWAWDPRAQIQPLISMRQREASRAGLVVRSPVGFHSDVVVEVTLASSVIAANEPISGQIALRSGDGANFKAIDLAIATTATIIMARGDRRHNPLRKIRIEAEELRGGRAMNFMFPPIGGLPPTFHTSFINNDIVLLVSLDLPWAIDPRFSVQLDVLPVGSIIHGEGAALVVGSERLRRLAGAMARATGLHQSERTRGLVEGKIGPCQVTLSDAPRGARLGIDIDITFPDVELGIVFRQVGLLDGFRESPLLPPEMNAYFLRCEPHDERPPLGDDATKPFIAKVLDRFVGTEGIRFSDHHFATHQNTVDDDEARMVEIARIATTQAKSIGDAISALPFPAPLAASRAAWQATATEQNAFLVPSGPSIHGIEFRARVLSGDERMIRATLRTIWKTQTPTLEVTIDLHDLPIPEPAQNQLEQATTHGALLSVRQVFSIMHAQAGGTSATLVHDGWPTDPRALLPTIEMFFAWILEARGERRVDMPYR